MLKLFKYLKPYAFLIILSIVLLFVQANADLALPDYLSKIVNIGIQHGGIESAVPNAIRQVEMKKISIFLTSEENNRVLANYTLVTKDSINYSGLVKQFPLLSEEPIYVLNKKMDQNVIDWMNSTLAKPIVIVYGIEQAIKNPESVSAFTKFSKFDFSKIPSGKDPFLMLESIPGSQQSAIIGSIKDGLSDMDSTVLKQLSTMAVKAEYSAIGINASNISTTYILHIGIYMLLLTLLSGACTIAVGYLSARTAAGLARDLRHAVFQRVESFSSTEFDRFSTASLITRSTNDVTQIQMVVIMMMRMVFYAPIIGIGGVIRAMAKSTNMWWIIALAVIVLLGLIVTIFSIALPKFKIVQSLIDRLNLVARENLTGMLVIRAFNMQGFEEDRFDKANVTLTRNSLFINRVMVIMMPLMMFIMNAVSLLIIWVGAHQVAQATLEVGDMMAFMQYAMQIVFSFLMLAMMFIILPRAAVSGDRIAEVLQTQPVIKDPESPKQFPEPFEGVVEFRDVSFRYPGAEEDVLHNISFTARPGETTAIIGTTGSGKSTIISLIPRFYDVSNGEILVDGVNILEVTQHDLRDKIGYIPQKGNLFQGTIQSNLLIGDENASDEDLQKAIQVSQAEEFIIHKPEGMLSEVAQGGMNVSGGQKQRLAIARALVKKAPINIFDDSFSALDFKTDAALRSSLKEYFKLSTTFIVTQRIATIMNSEQIIVLDDGNIVGKGKHKDLMKECEVYRGIAISQLSKEELA